jgi:hypothetical protein
MIPRWDLPVERAWMNEAASLLSLPFFFKKLSPKFRPI